MLELWSRYLVYVGISFHISKTGVIIEQPNRIKRINIQKALRDLLNAYSKHHHCNYSVTKINIILKAINPGYSLEGLRLKLKLQYLLRRADSLEKTLMLEKIEGRRRRGRQRKRCLRHHRFHGQEFEQALGDGEGQGSLAYYLPPWVTNRHDWLNNNNKRINKNLKTH